MAAGKAAVSASGAAMSKYDVEVEARLKKIEAEIGEIKKALEEHKKVCTEGPSGDVGERLDDLITRLNKKFRF